MKGQDLKLAVDVCCCFTITFSSSRVFSYASSNRKRASETACDVGGRIEPNKKGRRRVVLIASDGMSNLIPNEMAGLVAANCLRNR